MAIVAVRRPCARNIGHARPALRDLPLARRLQSSSGVARRRIHLRASPPLKPSIELKEKS
jgi:hypothetical protein